MDFDLNEEQQMIKKMVADFADKEIAPVAAQYDQEEKFPEEIVKKMGALGIFGTVIPEEYGGGGFDYISHALVAEELGRVDSSVRGIYSVQISLVTLSILRWGTEDQKRMYVPRLASGEILGCFGLTEPNSGSDVASMQASAVLDGDSYVLNGNKMWISNGCADVALIFAKTDKSAGHRGITAFIVDTKTPGFSSRDIHGKLGLRASSTAELILEDVRVPKENVLGNPGDGFKVAMSALDNGRYTVAAGCVGTAQGCYDVAKKYALERVQFGKPIAGHQLIQEHFAEMAINIDAGRFLVYRAGHLKNKGVRCTREVSMAKLFCSEMVNRVAYRAIQIFGGYGFSNEFPVERFYRDARINTLYEGTSEIQKLIIASGDLGISAFV
ncbi:MAG TPA: acyl-CoA dehydrogenase family protein [Thermosynergistes sp.]|nr:acyl-CoA dehydrogenase family protein [Thermosynergistes sp.]HOK19938.1 acyl-CoA dehydrogenase family protein [Thermosynergistes sp.]HOM24756.1 acyl-CoA dehydrogenase family protein [Thermosynergistes sp.]HPP36954.1 acyl-CoA dehydrogenase family protein [Thermosynergistes sp.]HPU76739.1 acyl-CoA dehydrogenase family protein [Thermosynergistes sp.]